MVNPQNYQIVSQKRIYIKLQGYGGKGSDQGMEQLTKQKKNRILFWSETNSLTGNGL